MGFQPRRDNQGLRHRIFAPIAGNTVTPVIDAPVASLGVAHDPAPSRGVGVELPGRIGPPCQAAMSGRLTLRSWLSGAMIPGSCSGLAARPIHRSVQAAKRQPGG